jgi:hypothetical protein
LYMHQINKMILFVFYKYKYITSKSKGNINIFYQHMSTKIILKGFIQLRDFILILNLIWVLHQQLKYSPYWFVNNLICISLQSEFG